MQVQATLVSIKEMAGWTFYGCLVSAVSVVIFGIVFWVVKSLLNQFLTIAQGKTEDEQEQTKIGEKAKKLMEREDDIGLMMRSVHDSISSFATVISGIKTATEELKSVSDDFNNIFHDMEDSLKITQDSTHTIPKITTLTALTSTTAINVLMIPFFNISNTSTCHKTMTSNNANIGFKAFPQATLLLSCSIIIRNLRVHQSYTYFTIFFMLMVSEFTDFSYFL